MERLTPLEIEKSLIPVRFRGYDRKMADDLLKRASKEIETLRADLRHAQSTAESSLQELERYRAQEETLKSALVLAQSAAEQTRANACKEAELILEEARRSKQEIIRQAEESVENLRWQLKNLIREKQATELRFKSMLEEHIRMLDNDIASDVSHSVVSLEVHDATSG